MRAVYRRLLHIFTAIRVRVFAARERDWKNRAESSARSYWERRNDPSTDFVQSAIDAYQPRSCLEVGSNVGNRLYRMALANPDVEYVGVDLNERAIQYGTDRFNEDGIRNVRLLNRSAQQLRSLGERQFDVVFSWATLIYVPPRDIRDVLHAMISLAKKACVLLEMHGVRGVEFSSRSGRLFPPGNWMRDYEEIIHSIEPDLRVTRTPVPTEIWQPGGGGAALITVERTGS